MIGPRTENSLQSRVAVWPQCRRVYTCTVFARSQVSEYETGLEYCTQPFLPRLFGPGRHRVPRVPSVSSIEERGRVLGKRRKAILRKRFTPHYAELSFLKLNTFLKKPQTLWTAPAKHMFKANECTFGRSTLSRYHRICFARSSRLGRPTC